MNLSPAWKLWKAGWISGGTRARPPAEAPGKRARSAPLAPAFATRLSIVAATHALLPLQATVSGRKMFRGSGMSQSTKYSLG